MSDDGSEAKREAFVRLAEKRTNAVIEKLRILSNCANPYAYNYSEQDIKRIFDAIDEEVKAVKAKFQQSKRPKKQFRLGNAGAGSVERNEAVKGVVDGRPKR